MTAAAGTRLFARDCLFRLVVLLIGLAPGAAAADLFTIPFPLRPTFADAALAGEPFSLWVAEPDGAPYRERLGHALRQLREDRRTLAACRLEPAACPAHARRFLEVIESGRTLVGRARLGDINRAINLAIKYTSDLDQHAAPDIWSSPLATFASGKGDCEDYALAKLLALEEVGVPSDSLRIVIVEDVRRRGGHAVLAARHEHRWLILDNARFPLIEDRDLTRYRPLIGLQTLDEDIGQSTRHPLSAAERSVVNAPSA